MVSAAFWNTGILFRNKTWRDLLKDLEYVTLRCLPFKDLSGLLNGPYCAFISPCPPDQAEETAPCPSSATMSEMKCYFQGGESIRIVSPNHCL